jgi:rod shape-determining protein MreC
MRNFIRFISRFFNLILFLVLEVVCAVLIARTNTLQGNDLLSSSNAVSGFFYNRQKALVYYFDLGTMNDSLLTENTRLREQLASLKHSTDTLRDSVAVRAVPGSDTGNRITYAKYIYRTARVINNSVTQRNNYITINRGSAHGIRKDMAVISGTGVVGRVVHTSKNFATILSVLSAIQTVSAHLKDGTTGQVTWVHEGKTPTPDILYLPDIPGEIPMRQGDSVWTTTYSFFPPDVLIGTISNVQIVKKTGKRILYLKPATNFRNMMYVYVVENTFQQEQRKLEALNTPTETKPKPKGPKKR